MQLPLQTFPTLLQNMAASVQGSAQTLLNLTAGSVLRAILEANASLALWVQWLIVQVLAATRAATSNGADLDTWVGDFGVTRLPGQPATTSLTFARYTTGFTASIPAGAQVKTADTLQTFTVLADPSNPAFSAASQVFVLPASASSLTVPARAMTAGVSGNVQAGAITLLATAIPGIDTVTNTAPAAGGLDAESDAALRTRFTNFIDSRSRATPAAIAYTIQSLQQGLDFALAENADPSGAQRPGFFTVTIDDGSGAPPPVTLSAVQAALDAVRPLGTQFAVVPPSLIIANITLTLTTPADTHATAQLAAQNAIIAFTEALTIGAPLAQSRLAALAYAADPSISNVTGLTINGGGDLMPPISGIIRPGTITVN